MVPGGGIRTKDTTDSLPQLPQAIGYQRNTPAMRAPVRDRERIRRT